MTTTATTASIEQPTDQHHHSTGRGSTRTGRQSTCCSPHISRCNADIGPVQSTGHTTATSIECCEKEKRCTTRHRDATHTHTHTLWMARRCGQRAQARVVQGGRTRRTELAQTTKGMKSGWQHGMAHPFCCAADDPLESTNPSVTCKKREGPNTQ